MLFTTVSESASLLSEPKKKRDKLAYSTDEVVTFKVKYNGGCGYLNKEIDMKYDLGATFFEQFDDSDITLADGLKSLIEKEDDNQRRLFEWVKYQALGEN